VYYFLKFINNLKKIIKIQKLILKWW